MITLPRAYEIYAILRQRLLRKKRLLNKGIFFYHMWLLALTALRYDVQKIFKWSVSKTPSTGIRFCLKKEIFSPVLGLPSTRIRWKLSVKTYLFALSIVKILENAGFSFTSERTKMAMEVFEYHDVIHL